MAEHDDVGLPGPEVEKKPPIEQDPAAAGLHELAREAGGPLEKDRLGPERRRQIEEKTGRRGGGEPALPQDGL